MGAGTQRPRGKSTTVCSSQQCATSAAKDPHTGRITKHSRAHTSPVAGQTAEGPGDTVDFRTNARSSAYACAVEGRASAGGRGGEGGAHCSKQRTRRRTLVRLWTGSSAHQRKAASGWRGGGPRKPVHPLGTHSELTAARACPASRRAHPWRAWARPSGARQCRWRWTWSGACPPP